MRAILIDDEQKARNMLRSLLEEYCPEVEIVTECSNVPTAVAAINDHKPDVVFLDIDMPGYNGFQLLEFFNPVNFEVIFTTAHSEYALQAFRVSALDYLQKPIDIDLLVAAVEKLKARHGNSIINEQLALLRTNDQAKAIEKIALPIADGIVFIQVKDIVQLQAERAYTSIHLKTGQPIMASKNIKEFEEILANEKYFYRCHRSNIINLKEVQKYVKSEGGYIEMSNGNSVSISKDLRDDFLRLMDNL
jgi:two-component system LytT family response regulator